MKVLVTGSNGTIGTRLCETLIDQGKHLVTGIDVVKERYHETVRELTTQADLRFGTGTDLLTNLAAGWKPNVVVHLANHARVANLVKDPCLAAENMMINFNVLEACRRAGVKKVIFGSSREVYGNTSTIRTEGVNETPVYISDCISPYSASKMSGEALCHAYAECYGMDFTILRFSNVYGMYDFSDRVIPRWIQCIDECKPMELYGSEKTLDFTYIDDTIAGIIGVIGMLDKKPAKPSPNAKGSVQTFNLASGEETKLFDVAIKLGELMNAEPILHIKGNHAGEVVHYRADIRALHEATGYVPVVSIDTGLRRTIQWYKEKGYVTSDED